MSVCLFFVCLSLDLGVLYMCDSMFILHMYMYVHVHVHDIAYIHDCTCACTMYIYVVYIVGSCFCLQSQ